MRIRLLMSLATDLEFFLAGARLDWDEADAQRLIAAGRAVAEPGDTALLATAVAAKNNPKRADRASLKSPH